MPSRVIRGEINSSLSLSQVSMQADLTFRALLVAVDDFGRMDARSDMLKAALFPTRAEATPTKIEKWLAELVEAGCVVLYEAKTTAEGAKVEQKRRYLALPSWEKHRGKQKRAAESRFPAPPEIPGAPRDSQDSQDIRLLGSGGLGGGLGDETDIRGDPRIPARAPRSPYCPPAEAVRRLESLKTAILVSIPRQAVPHHASSRGQRWATELDRLHRLDGWSWEDIDAVIAWLPTHESSDFRWGLVIRSAANLRKHFAMMHAQMTKAKKNGGYRTTPDTSQPKGHHEVRAEAALASLKAEEDRTYSIAEIEARMEEMTG